MIQITRPLRPARTRRPVAMRGISRIDIPASRTHGWEVRITRRGVAHAKFFADRGHGGKRKALEAAKQERDRIVAENPGYTRKELAKKLRASNTSGITGVVHRTVKVRRNRKVHEYEAWVATGSPEPGVRKTKVFYVNKWGEKARDLAVKQRRRWEREMSTASS
ncbi:AP2 domain-containing protein [Verrucomicrobiota bacterium sgz303538]